MAPLLPATHLQLVVAVGLVPSRAAGQELRPAEDVSARAVLQRAQRSHLIEQKGAEGAAAVVAQTQAEALGGQRRAGAVTLRTFHIRTNVQAFCAQRCRQTVGADPHPLCRVAALPAQRRRLISGRLRLHRVGVAPRRSVRGSRRPRSG